MQIIKKYFWQLITLFLIILLFVQNSCDSPKIKNGTIIIPPKKGSFNYKKPQEIKYLIKTKYITTSGDTIELENPINVELAKLYKLETDNLKRELLYYKSIQQRKYKQTFEDKNLKADVYALTTGTLDSIKLDYTIKSDTIKVKQPVFSLLAGISLGTNINTLKPNLKANIGFQNKRRDILLIGGNNNEVSVSYIKNIFTIKK